MRSVVDSDVPELFAALPKNVDLGVLAMCMLEATKLDEVSYLDVLNQGLRAMDSTAITLCMDNHLPIVMFDLLEKGNVRAILEGRPIGTLVR